MKLLARLACRPDSGTQAVVVFADGDYPALYRAADAHSIAQQKRFFGALLAELVLLVLATVFSIVSSSSPDVAVLQALTLVVTLACAIYLFWAKPDRHWYSARAVAESVKTTTWRYATRAEPFNTDDELARELFSQRLQAVINQNRDVAQRFCTDLDGVQLTATMDALRQSSLEDRRRAYVEGRVVEQKGWYARKAKANDCLGQRFFVLLVATILLALGFAVLRVRFPQAPFWPTDGIVATASVLLAWTQSKRFSELAASYALAAHEISIIQIQSSSIGDEPALSKFIGDAENAFSREHTQWVARKDV